MGLHIVDVVGVESGLGVDLLEKRSLSLSRGESDALLLVSVRVRLRMYDGRVETMGLVLTLEKDGGDSLGTAVTVASR